MKRITTDVCVIGAGPIGLCAAVLAKHGGAAKVIVSDTRPSRRALAQRMGLPIVVDPLQEGIDILVRIGGPGSWPDGLEHRHLGTPRHIFAIAPADLLRITGAQQADFTA